MRMDLSIHSNNSRRVPRMIDIPNHGPNVEDGNRIIAYDTRSTVKPDRGGY